jgi:hypothetical protein
LITWLIEHVEDLPFIIGIFYLMQLQMDRRLHKVTEVSQTAWLILPPRRAHQYDKQQGAEKKSKYAKKC